MLLYNAMRLIEIIMLLNGTVERVFYKKLQIRAILGNNKHQDLEKKEKPYFQAPYKHE